MYVLWAKMPTTVAKRFGLHACALHVHIKKLTNSTKHTLFTFIDLQFCSWNMHNHVMLHTVINGFYQIFSDSPQEWEDLDTKLRQTPKSAFHGAVWTANVED